ncbi:MAG: hypothetical protein IKG82_11940, partial [Oscillospiraceae bacterium]|nr:hypothetical protein [Oscillospiraceae bacterium]
MKKMLILSICVSLMAICSSCGIDVEQQMATNNNGLAVAEQTEQEGHKSKGTTEKIMETEDVTSEDSAESSSELASVPVETTTATKSSDSNAKTNQCETTKGCRTSDNTMNIESQNPGSTTNNTPEVTGTTDTPKNNSSVTKSYEQKMKERYDTVVENAISDRPYNDVIKSSVSDELLIWHLDFTMNPWESAMDSPISMNDRYKIELIRSIDDQRMYSIQKPESGGLFYSFYVNSGLQCTAYITKSLYFADYNAIKVGSSIDDVIAIEPATQAYIKRNRTYDNLSNDGETA